MQDNSNKVADNIIKSLEGNNFPKSRKPPIHLWNLPLSGDLDMQIKPSGEWLYLGTPIARHQLVSLFASILRREDDGCYYLVTPVEKWRIKVEDVPFVVVIVEESGLGEDQSLCFKTNVGDEIVAGADHPIRVDFDPVTGEPKPYLHVRDKLEALISRNVYYQLVGLAEEKELNSQQVAGVYSGGKFFSLGCY